jgi:hypothetical protein
VTFVEFGGFPALQMMVYSSNLITATSPPTFGTGSVTVYVTVVTLDDGSSADSAASRFTYNQSAALSQLPGKPPL